MDFKVFVVHVFYYFNEFFIIILIEVVKNRTIDYECIVKGDVKIDKLVFLVAKS